VDFTAYYFPNTKWQKLADMSKNFTKKYRIKNFEVNKKEDMERLITIT